MLAADLGLPVPELYVVTLEADFVDRAALPPEWAEADDAAAKAIRRVTEVRDNLARAMQEIVRVLQ